MGTEIQARMDEAVVELARRIPVDQIPSVLAFLSARLLAEGSASRNSEHDGESACDAEKLLTAGELAERLNLAESWIRNEERLGHIPSIRAGRYVRFRLSDVERALTERQRQKGVTVRQV
jgi:excisionase family DNA binding protein